CAGPGPAKCLGCAAEHYGPAKGLPTALGNWALGAAERASVDMFLPVSHATAAGNGLPGSRLPYQVIPNFVPDATGAEGDDLRPYLAQLPDEGYLLFVGDLRPLKGLDVLLRAYAGLAGAPPLVLIGKVWAETPAELPPNVVVLRDWPNHAVMAAWRRSIAAVVPSIWPEPFGIVVIEAMASGRPVVGSRIGGIPDLVADGETGLLVPPGNPTALRDALARLLDDPELRERMGQAARWRAAEFRATSVVPRIERVYAELLASSSAAVVAPAIPSLTPAAAAAPPLPCQGEGEGRSFHPLSLAWEKGPGGEGTPLVSVVVNNYNYGRFLGAAIDSALGQTYLATEVIVVDDGSTDDSRAVIAGYGERVQAVLKPNGGQASAFNAGFARSRGAIVLFLDADDVLLPQTVQRVAAAFRAHPGAAKVMYRMAIVDARGRPTGAFKPDLRRRLPHGDLRRQVLAFPDDIAWQPTSGNAFAAGMLRRILPMPEAPYWICADYYLSNLPPLFGPVVALDEVGAHYRVHDANNHHAAAIDLDQMRQLIVRTSRTHEQIKRCAATLGLAGFPADPTAVRSVTFVAHRMASLKLDPARHPVAGDWRWGLFDQGARAALGRFDLPPAVRLAYVLWFAAMLFAPRPLARWLTARLFFPKRRDPSPPPLRGTPSPWHGRGGRGMRAEGEG
ncbi:MAG TPA: glycosyltransferase, partial [Roseiflexaceae bacterium]